MKNYRILKLIGLVLLTMMTLVMISFIEVAVYSYLIYPGQDMSVYETHANSSAPYISGIFGFIFFYLIARYWTIKEYPDVFKLIILFPILYILLDLVIITAAGVNWSDFFIIFVLANSAKFLGAFLGYKINHRQRLLKS